MPSRGTLRAIAATTLCAAVVPLLFAFTRGGSIFGLQVAVGLSGLALSAALFAWAKRAHEPWASFQAEEIYRLRVQLTHDQIRRSGLAPIGAKRLVVLGLALLLLGGLLVIVAVSSEAMVPLLLVGAALLLLGFRVALFPLGWLVVRGVLRPSFVPFTQPHELFFSRVGFGREGVSRRADFRATWSTYARLRELPDLFLIQPRWYALSQQVIVPKSAFRNAREMDRFRERVRGRWMAASTHRSAAR